MRVFAKLIPPILILAVAAPAIAQQQPAAPFVPGGVFALPPKERFAATDKNKDGKVTPDEYKSVLNADAAPYVVAIFERIDTNKDGWLTETEMSPQAAGRGGAAAGRGPAPAAQPK